MERRAHNKTKICVGRKSADLLEVRYCVATANQSCCKYVASVQETEPVSQQIHTVVGQRYDHNSSRPPQGCHGLVFVSRMPMHRRTRVLVAAMDPAVQPASSIVGSLSSRPQGTAAMPAGRASMTHTSLAGLDFPHDIFIFSNVNVNVKEVAITWTQRLQPPVLTIQPPNPVLDRRSQDQEELLRLRQGSGTFPRCSLRQGCGKAAVRLP